MTWAGVSGWQISNGAASLPLGNRLLVDPVAPGQRPQARLTMLYRSTDCLSRRGAPVKNLAQRASFHSREKTAPSKSGTKPLVPNALIRDCDATLRKIRFDIR
jgi:hypothetical protein